MLRNLVTRLDSVGTWPCDEINGVWRHGNISYPSDELKPQLATHAVKRFINTQFDKLARKNRCNTIVEKTCANSLRVPFVNEVVGRAKYIFIVRNGVDAVASAYRRWHAKMEYAYLLRKARFVPLLDIPIYASRFVANRIRRMRSTDKRLVTWGPVMDNMTDLQKQYSTIAVCALQWQACVDKAEDGLRNISGDRVLRVKYEDFATEPVAQFSRIVNFVGRDDSKLLGDYLRNHVSKSNIGKGHTQLTDNELRLISPLIDRTQKRHGYG